MVNDTANDAGDLGFDTRDGEIGHSVANAAAFLRSCVAQAQRRGDESRTRTTDREKQLRALYRSENALRALNNLTRLENRLTAGSRFG